MIILILGATGMLGHKLLQNLSRENEVYGSLRSYPKSEVVNRFLHNFNLIKDVDAFSIGSVKKALTLVKPEVIVNSIGIVKQLPEAHDPIKSITINSLFPHQLAQICKDQDIRLIHYSTDCVFNGRRGSYKESDVPDAEDLYGRTKLLGEVQDEGCLTLRTSLIGRELHTSQGLIEWFLSQTGSVRGYKNTIFSGLTTNAQANVLNQIISNYPKLTGLYHLAAEPISKFDLLTLIKNQYGLNTVIEPDYREISDRSLDASKFKSETKIIIPKWPEMLQEMYSDSTPYRLLRE